MCVQGDESEERKIINEDIQPSDVITLSIREVETSLNKDLWKFTSNFNNSLLFASQSDTSITIVTFTSSDSKEVGT